MAEMKKAFSIVNEFKSFALKGNVVDLAIGVIIGGAFGKIVDSLVKPYYHAGDQRITARESWVPCMETGDQWQGYSLWFVYW